MKSTEQTRAMAQNVLDYIHENPEKHDQEVYFDYQNGQFCGTSMCIAGTAVFLEYGENAFKFEVEEIEKRARKLLGLESDEEEYALFLDFNNESALQKLKKIVVGEEFSEADLTDYDLTDD